MTATFWTVAALFCGVALSIVLVPILRHGKRGGRWSFIGIAAAVAIVPLALFLYSYVSNWDPELAANGCGGRYDCTYQGISAGCSDVYDAALQCQWIDITGIPNGRYVIPRYLMRDPDFRAGFAELGRRNLSFDAMIYHPQLPELADLARAFPDTTIVLNHVGGPLDGTQAYAARREEAAAQWRAGITELARCPNVYVKLGGLGMPYLGFGLEKLPTPASSEQLARAWAPHLEHCVQSFGPRRCMFESNFPPDRASADFHVLWNAFKRFAARYSAEEKRALFHDTAASEYRLNLP